MRKETEALLGEFDAAHGSLEYIADRGQGNDALHTINRVASLVRPVVRLLADIADSLSYIHQDMHPGARR